MSALEPTAAPEAKPMAGPAGVFHDGWVVTLRNLRRMTRIPEVVVFATIQPIMFVLLFSYVFGGAIPLAGSGGSHSYREYLLPGIFTQTLAFTTGTTAVGLADDLQKGLVDRFRSLPMARSAVLLGRTVADWIQNLFVLLIMALCGVAIGWRIHDGFWRALAAFLLVMLFAYAMSWVGAVIGLTVSTPETANTAGFIWLFPVTFISNVFVPTQSLPGWLQPVAEWNPISSTVLALRELFGNPTGFPPGGLPDVLPMQHPELVSPAWSLLILLVFVPIAVRKYRSVSR
jgi:ABC-2 type transport system permease protein